ncbi:MAG TPA: Rieske (2Fe-2S) protein [Verrucomicrobiae bacterium]
MKLNRRQFLLLTAGLAAGCQTAKDVGGSARTVNAGSIGNYANDGVYNNFRDEGFFLIRRAGKLFALSAICTHRKCKLIAEPDRSFYCKCHGSTFDPNGHVTEGPARLDLPVLPSFTNEHGQLIVTVTAT